MRAKEIMTRTALWCEPDEDTHAVAELMRDKNVGFLPVLEDADSRRIIGVVTDRDLCLRVIAAGFDPRFVKVRECMTTLPVCCHEDDPAEGVLTRMTRNRVRRLPVINREQHLLGVISIEDLVRAAELPPKKICDALKRIFRPAANRVAA